MKVGELRTYHATQGVVVYLVTNLSESRIDALCLDHEGIEWNWQLGDTVQADPLITQFEEWV